MASSKKDYFGLGRVASIILAILPTNYILGVLTRFQEKHYLAAILRLLVFGWNVLYILDLIFIILNGRILRVL